jgi:hypothetical protein
MVNLNTLKRLEVSLGQVIEVLICQLVRLKVFGGKLN